MIVSELDEASGPRPGIAPPRAGATTAPPTSAEVFLRCVHLARTWASDGVKRVTSALSASSQRTSRPAWTLDVEAPERSVKLGAQLARIGMPNADQDFVDGLAGVGRRASAPALVL